MAWLKEGLLWVWASTEASLDWSPSLLKVPKARAWEVMLHRPDCLSSDALMVLLSQTPCVKFLVCIPLQPRSNASCLQNTDHENSTPSFVSFYDMFWRADACSVWS